jgi:hypothetical protein
MRRDENVELNLLGDSRNIVSEKMRREGEMSKRKSFAKKNCAASSTPRVSQLVGGTRTKVEKALATNEIRGQARRITQITTPASHSNHHWQVAIVVNPALYCGNFQVQVVLGLPICRHMSFFRLKCCCTTLISTVI